MSEGKLREPSLGGPPPRSDSTKSCAGRRASSGFAAAAASAKKGGCWAAAGAAMQEDDAPAQSKDSSGEKSPGGLAGKWGKLKGAHKEQATLKDTLTFDSLFKRYELAKAFSLDSAQVRRDAKRVKKRLNDANRFLLNTESRIMQTWDFTTVIALIFTLLVSPYEIGFLDGLKGPGAKALEWINHTVSLCFGTDMVLNFFRPYKDALGQKVKSHRKIAVVYLKVSCRVYLLLHARDLPTPTALRADEPPSPLAYSC